MATDNLKLITDLLKMYAYSEAKADSSEFDENINNLKHVSASGNIFQLSHRKVSSDILDSTIYRSVLNYKLLQNESSQHASNNKSRKQE
mgnify:CR=1 FL=1